MKKGGLRLVGTAPSGPGFAATLRACAKAGSVVTSLDDAALRTAADILSEEGTVELLGFGELVGRVKSMLGLPLLRIPAEGQMLALVAAALQELPVGSMFSDVARFSGWARTVSACLHELRHWGYGPQELRRAAPSLPDDLARKVLDLAWVQEFLDERLAASNRELQSDRIEAILAADLREPLPIERIVVLAAGRRDPLGEDFIAWLANHKVKVTVLVDCFAGHTLLTSNQLVESLGGSLDMSYVRPSWVDALFTDGTSEATPEILVMSTPDPLSEAEWAVRECQRRISEGALPHRITLFTRDSESYGPLVRASALRQDVPVEMTLSRPLLANGLASSTLRLLEALASDDVRNLVPLTRSSYVGADFNQEVELRNAVLESFQFGALAWSSLTTWLETTGESHQWLYESLGWRSQHLEAETTIKDWLQSLRELVGIAFPAVADGQALEETRARDERAMTAMQRTLADEDFVARLLARPNMSLKSFVRLVRAAWENATVTWPSGPEGVQLVGSTARLGECDTVIALGMLEGGFPRRRSEDPLLFDYERQTLHETLPGSLMLPTSRDRARQEREHFLRLCATPTARLILSYPQTDDDRDNIPAFYIDEVRRAVGAGVQQMARHGHPPVPAEEECRSQADLALARAFASEPVTPSPPVLTSEVAKNLIRPKASGVSIEALAAAAECPFRAGLRVLDVLPDRRRGARTLLSRIARKADLPTAQDPESAEASLRSELEKLVFSLRAELDPWEVELLRKAGERMIPSWVEAEFQARWIWKRVEVRKPVLIGESREVNERLRIDGETVAIHVSERLPAIATIGGRRTGIAYLSGTLKRLDGPVDEADASITRHCLLLLALSRNVDSYALEVDNGQGGRTLWVVDEHSGGLQSLRPTHTVKTASTEPIAFKKHAFSVVERAYRVLKEASMRPRPGDYCRLCDFGELCRFSLMYGEAAVIRDDEE